MATLGFINGGNLTSLTSLGIGTASPQTTLHVQGSTLVTNPTIYNSSSGGWYNIGLWDCTADQINGAHLKVKLMGCAGYNGGAGSGTQAGGESTIYLTNLNNANTGTVNVDGWWKHEGGNVPFSSVKVVQNGSSRFQYYIWVNISSGYTQHSINAETTGGTIWTTSYTSGTDPGTNSATVQLIVLNTAAIGTNVGIGTTSPVALLHCYNPSNISLLLDNGTNSTLIYQASSSGGLYIRTGTGTTGGSNGLFLTSGGGFFGPNADNATTLGGGSNRWTTVYAMTGTINTSDARQKTNVESSSLGLEFINKLNPVSYKWISGQGTLDDNGNQVSVRPGRRIFYGFLAQEVKNTLDELAVPDFAGWTLDDINNPDSAQGLRYTEFIAPMVKSIQELSAENTALKTQMTSLEQSLATATANFSSLEARLAALEGAGA